LPPAARPHGGDDPGRGLGRGRRPALGATGRGRSPDQSADRVQGIPDAGGRKLDRTTEGVGQAREQTRASCAAHVRARALSARGMAGAVSPAATPGTGFRHTDEVRRGSFRRRGRNIMSTVIKARGLTKRYKSTRALDNVDLDIESGRIVGLIGPNGAGKTTAL